MRIQLSPSLPVYQGPHIQRRRAEFTFEHKGQLIHIYRSHLTMLCLTGFAIADRRHWVVDHINNITLDDRPSNLQVITQRENSARSKRLQRIMRLSPAERMRQRLKRQAKMQERKLQLMAIYPDADMIDIELELAIEMQEWDYGKI